MTQQNAANAEESASSSQEMSVQTKQMRVFVEKLVSMVGSNGQRDSAGSVSPPKPKPSGSRAIEAGSPGGKQASPSDDDEFKEF